ncbi:MAG TPA: 2-oxoacid:acceptor oxidoreductase subunit alpha [Saprospiraceae bacterium]|nr:2-oxoacid:acceptor oxidoreductase subunit alpha [Saprospiraceae bacterium]HNT19804.1 2-oxoacid:acceptor oxidoreductase subunit alpha [Saprospiraceae bacterium]
MSRIEKINDCVIRFANVNGTGSASANNLFAKAIFRMGVPVSPKNIFPSNIQGLPTWYEIRVNEKGHLGRRNGIDIMVSINPQSLAKDIASVSAGGYFIYDNTKPMPKGLLRDEVNNIGIPMTEICAQNYADPRQRLLFKNMVYVGAVATLLDMEMAVLEQMVSDQFKGKEKLITPNVKALHLGRQYLIDHFELPSKFRIERRDLNKDLIMIDGNSACALGALYGGATVAAWYPITPSTSLMSAFDEYASSYRLDPKTGKKKFAFVQAEDELAAIGIAIGANWNGARGFTATSGPGISLMSEFLGLAYFAEIPLVLIDVQRGGPSTGMPTRTQQSDILACAYASHGDTKHPLLFPSTPRECFEMTAEAFDLAEQLQTPIILMSDLDLGMNEHSSQPLVWDDRRNYKRGKVLNAAQLDEIKEFGRYLDVDGDGIPYRTIPGTHPTKGSFFTRGTSRDEMARYTEESEPYVRNMDRLLKKWDTIKNYLPAPEWQNQEQENKMGMLYFGTSESSSLEAADLLEEKGIHLDLGRIRAFPFHPSIADFIQDHQKIFVVEQNRDAQMRTLLINELDVDPARLIPVLNYDGLPITGMLIHDKIMEHIGYASTTLTDQHDLRKTSFSAS